MIKSLRKNIWFGRFALAGIVSVTCACVSGAKAADAEAPKLFPFALPWDDGAPGPTDLSHWLKKPAGVDGFVFAKRAHLYVNDASERSGLRRVRFMGVNTSFAANFPTHEQAEKTAARLAKFGVNCVRLHHMDRDPAPKGLWNADMVTFNPEQLDRLDYFAAQLKARGIYTNINLHVSRFYPGMPQWDTMPMFHKGVDLFMPEMIALQKQFARDLLHHVNPYTGLAYFEDPAVAIVEINNENGLISRWWEKALDEMPDVYVKELEKQWQAWRAAQGLLPTAEKMIFRRDFAQHAEERRKEWMRFLWDTERNYWVEMQRFLKEDLQVKSLIVGTQLYSYSTLPIQAEMDVVDIHAYWQHPEFPEGRKNTAVWTVGNESMVNHAEARTISDHARQRVADKPLLVTEYNHSSPNTYGAETFLMIAAYSAFQDWDGFFAYSYAHGNQPWDEAKIVGSFDMYQHSLKMASLPVAAALFLRGDVQAGQTVQTTHASAEQFLDLTGKYGVNIGGQHFGANRQDALRHRQALQVGRDATALTTPPRANYAGGIVSDTRELLWDADAPHGKFTVDTPRSKAVVGFTDAATFELGAVSITPGKTIQGWSAISLTQLEGEVLGNNGRALLLASGTLENTDMKWKNEQKNSVSSWGKAPVVVEGISAQISLKTTGAVEVWSLDERGQRRAPLTVEKNYDGVSFYIGDAYRTLWYEVTVKGAK
jgi:hypothetical protein